jgi:hypothetical protein
MLFKAYSVQTLSAATSFVQDLKLGHYVKVPPRATFMGTFSIFDTTMAIPNVGMYSSNDLHDPSCIHPSRSEGVDLRQCARHV